VSSSSEKCNFNYEKSNESSSLSDLSSSEMENRRVYKKGIKGNTSFVSNCESKPKCQNDTNTEISNLVRAFSSLSNVKIPPQQKFDETSGTSLKQYLRKFEIFCRENYRCDRDFWVDELERNLSGKTLEVFKSMKEIDGTYDTIKENLIVWYDNLKEVRKKKSKEKFQNAKYKRGEGLFIFSTRLQSLFTLAYPNRKVEKSNTIQEKFLESVPKKYGSMISMQIMARKFSGKEATWKMIQKIARYADLHMEKAEEKNSDSEKEIVINFGDHNKYNGIENTNYQRGRTFHRQNHEEHHGKHWSRQQYKRSPQVERRFSRVPQHLHNRNKQCYSCGRIGHISKDCRIRMNLCFACGSPDHKIVNCPRRGQYNNRSQSQGPPNRREEVSANKDDYRMRQRRNSGN